MHLVRLLVDSSHDFEHRVEVAGKGLHLDEADERTSLVLEALGQQAGKVGERVFEDLVHHSTALLGRGWVVPKVHGRPTLVVVE